MMKEDPRPAYYNRLLTWLMVSVMIVVFGGTLLFAYFVPGAFTG